jgi:ABC-type molybdenum transport system ATPase subunit/photorepair protein PhrA
MTESLLKLRKVGLIRQGKTILKNVDLDIHAGEIIAPMVRVKARY